MLATYLPLTTSKAPKSKRDQVRSSQTQGTASALAYLGFTRPLVPSVRNYAKSMKLCQNETKLFCSKCLPFGQNSENSLKNAKVFKIGQRPENIL